MRGFGVAYQTKYLQESVNTRGEWRRSHRSLFERKDYQGHILFCSVISEATRKQTDMPDYYLSLLQ